MRRLHRPKGSGYSVAVAQLDGKMAVSAIRGRRNQARLGQIQRTDGDVIFVRVSERNSIVHRD
jgi:hypothetical protein